MAYKLYGSAKNRGFRALWLLEEIGLDYTHLPVPARSPEVVALNGTGKVPILISGDHTLTDSTAILTYLADKHGAFTFPAGTEARAIQDGHTQFLLDELDGLLWTAAKHSFALPEALRIPEIKPALREEFRVSCERLAQRNTATDGPFLMGEQMTIADIVAVHCLGWAIVAKFPMEREDLKIYSKALRARPAYKAASARV